MYKHYYDRFFVYCFFVSAVKNALIRSVLMQQISGKLQLVSTVIDFIVQVNKLLAKSKRVCLK